MTILFLLLFIYILIISSDTLQVLMFVSPTVLELRFYGCCHPCFLYSFHIALISLVLWCVDCSNLYSCFVCRPMPATLHFLLHRPIPITLSFQVLLCVHWLVNVFSILLSRSQILRLGCIVQLVMMFYPLYYQEGRGQYR